MGILCEIEIDLCQLTLNAVADGKPLHLVSRTALNKTPSNKFLRGAQVEHASTFFVAQVADVERIIPPKPSDSSEARTRSMTVPRGANGSRRETDHPEVGGNPCSAYRSLRVTRPCIPSLTLVKTNIVVNCAVVYTPQGGVLPGAIISIKGQ